MPNAYKMHHTLFALALLLSSFSPINAADDKNFALDADVIVKKMIGQEGGQISPTIEVDRAKVIARLGAPARSDEFFPYSGSSTIVDTYLIRKNTKKLRISYDRNNNVGAADVESAPLAIPKFMCEKVKKVSLTDGKLREFVKEQPEEDLRKMTPTQVSEKLGEPNHKWHETSRVGGRDFHFLQYLYDMSKDGKKVFVVMFDEQNNSIYEYRLQTVNALTEPGHSQSSKT